MTTQTLEALGPRVCIFGPSNAGKSTLAVALGNKLGVPAIHLDLLHHLPNTDWVPRAPEAFERLHDEAIAQNAWVIEGNYSRLISKRLARATGIVLIDTHPLGNLWRYLRRTLFERERIGTLAGGQDSLKWMMLRHITLVQPKSRARMVGFTLQSGLPFERVEGMKSLNRLYRRWCLTRP